MENKEDGKKKRYIVSEVLPSGEIIELVYREKYKQTMLAIFKDNKVAYAEKLERGDEILFPYPASSDLISKKIVLFPIEDKEYGSNNELFERIRNYIHKYVDIRPMFEEIAAYYVMFTWIYDRFNELAYIRALGEYGSGKSRFLQTIGQICYKPIFAGGATTSSPIFRIIDIFRGTLVLDEADYRFSDTTADIVKILNSGYQKGIPVLRSEGQGRFEVKSYDVFCPKVIATRERFDDIALESRFLIEEMDKKELREDIPLNLPQSFSDEGLEIRNRLLLWRFRNFNTTILREEAFDRSLEPRLNQIITPLLSIIDDEEVRGRLRETIKEYNDQLVSDRGMSLESEVFGAYLNCLEDGTQEPTMRQISDKFNEGRENPRDQLSAKRVGTIFRSKLRFLPTRTRDGYIVSPLVNVEKIKTMKRKFGFTEPVNEVNVVNNPREGEAIDGTLLEVDRPS